MQTYHSNHLPACCALEFATKQAELAALKFIPKETIKA
jgi:hypothetical protein